MMEEKQINWIDYGKVLGIFLVVYSHTDITNLLKGGIYTFLMPFFFFMSGYLFSFERNPVYKDFVIKRFKQLVVPYVWLNVITYLLWFFIGRKVGADAGEQVIWYEPVLSALWGNGKGMVHDIPLWFLMCLFVVENLYYIIFLKIKKKWIGLICLVIFAYLNYTFSPLHLPFSANTAFVGIIFYALGHLFCRQQSSFLKRPNILLFLLGLVVVVVVAIENGRTDMYLNYYNDYFWFVLGACWGIVMMVNLCYYLAGWFEKKEWIVWISKNTLIICGIHLTAFAFLKGIMVYVLGIPVGILHEKTGVNILFALLGLLVCLPAIYVINKYFPFVVGRKKVKPTSL